MTTSIAQYVKHWQSYQQSLSHEGSADTRQLLSLDLALSGMNDGIPSEVKFQRLNEQWRTVAFNHACCLYSLQQVKYANDQMEDQSERKLAFTLETYQLSLSIAQDLIRDFDRNTQSLLFRALNNLRTLALRYDSMRSPEKQSVSTADSQPKIEEAARTIMRAFNFCLNDRAPMETSRKWATYYILSLLFKTYIELKTINLCGNSLKAIAKAQLPDLSEYPKSHQVTFKYYLGFYHFGREEYTQALYHLMSSFQHCPAENIRTKRMILRYLLPTALLHGKLPEIELLKRYGYDSMYADIVTAMKTGNMRLYERAFGQQEHTFSVHGTFLVVEQLKILCLRSLVKKIWLLNKKSSRLMLSQVQVGMSLCGISMVIDEIECLCSVLIFKGYMKGYISHDKKTIVLSKGMPFPALSSVV